MTTNQNRWKDWGAEASQLLSWALKPVLFAMFIMLNWDNILPVIGFLIHCIVKALGFNDLYSPEETGFLIQSMEQFFGTALLTVGCYRWLVGLMGRLPFCTFEAEKVWRAQAELNRIKYFEVMRETLTLEKLELHKIQYKRDQFCLGELNEALRNLKLEVNALKTRKSATEKMPTRKDVSPDLFSKKKVLKPKRAPKRFVPIASRKQEPSEF